MPSPPGTDVRSGGDAGRRLRAGPVVAAFLAVLLAGGCVVRTPRPRQAGDDAWVLTGVPARPFGPQACGAGSLSAVLTFHGDPVSVERLDGELTRAPGGGVLSVDLLIAARRRGYDASLARGDPAAVAEEVLAGRPVILMLRVLDAPGRGADYYHYVVVDGYDADRDLFRFHFGDGKPRWSPMGRGLRRAWRGAGNAVLLVRPDPEVRLAARMRAAVELEHSGRLAEALAEYRAIVELDPGSVRAWTNLGNALYRSGQAGEAADAYQRALDADPGDANAANNLAWVLLESGALVEAEALARLASEREQANRDLVLDTLGRILLARGRCAEAAATFRRGLNWTPPDRPPLRANLLAGLARAHVDCGDVRGAQTMLEQALRHHPDPRMAETIRSDLAGLRAAEPDAPRP